MAVVYPFQSSLYLPTPITMGAGDGSSGVAFTGVNEPVSIPEFSRKRKVNITQLSPTDLGMPGVRVFEAYRARANHYDLEFTSDLVTPTNVDKIRSWVEPSDVDDANPGYVTVFLGEGPTYLGIMAEDFPVVTNYRYNGRICHKVAIRVHILGVTGTVITV